MRRLKLSTLSNRDSSEIFYRLFRSKVFPLLYKFFCYIPINNKKIVFLSDSRTEISGNFEFVYNELKTRKENYSYWFLLKKETSSKKSYIEIFRLSYELATSKYIFLDDFYPMIYGLKIKKKAELIQLWHAVGAFKTFGFSRIGKPGGPHPSSQNHRNYTKAIVSSSNIISNYAEGFGISKDKVIPTGIPRTDIFFDTEYSKTIREKLFSKYQFLRDKKIILFSPTFRGNGQQSAFYDFDKIDFVKLNEAMSDNDVLIFKMHPFVKGKIKIPEELENKFYDFSYYREINDLLFITDILITDYSSVCFEASLLNIPMLFYAYDLDSYTNDRDFYFDYSVLIPGRIVKTIDELSTEIYRKCFDTKKMQDFVAYFFDHLDGKSSKRVVDAVIYNNDSQLKY